MKIIKPEGTMPGIEDGLITYAGSFTGTASIYKIQTKCKTLLFTRITAYPTTAARPASLIEVPYTISVNTNSYKYVQFTAKAGYTFYYEVAGTEKTTMTNEELSVVSAGTFSWDGHHNHDGINSPNIRGTNIYVGSGYAGYVCVVGAGGYLAFVPSTAANPPAAITALKLETAPVATSPDSYQQVTPSSAGSIDIIWTPSGGSEGTGEGGNIKYKVYIEEFIPDISDSGTSSGNWAALVSDDSDTSGSDAKRENWDLNGAGYLEEGVLYRLYVVARNTVTGAQVVSTYGYFKLELPSA